jgi:hypothetical protein
VNFESHEAKCADRVRQAPFRHPEIDVAHESMRRVAVDALGQRGPLTRRWQCRRRRWTRQPADWRLSTATCAERRSHGPLEGGPGGPVLRVAGRAHGCGAINGPARRATGSSLFLSPGTALVGRRRMAAEQPEQQLLLDAAGERGADAGRRRSIGKGSRSQGHCR